jgi:hypothetical protein
MGLDEQIRRSKLMTRLARVLDEHPGWTAEDVDGGILISHNAPVVTSQPDAAATDDESDDEGEAGDVILTELTVADLRVLADTEGIDLSGADRKADIVAAIEAARANESAQAEQD